MHGIKTLFGTAVLVAGLAMAPAAHAQISINIGVQPVCSYGYYGYAPYACAPIGYYGPGYFYNGIFIGMGPWGGWGYSHGWGSHRFQNDGGGRYHGGPGRVSYHAGGVAHSRAAVSHSGGVRPSAAHRSTARTSTSRPAASHASASHANASHGAAGGHAGGDGHK
ncbi:MAG: hypothetical protein WCF17_11505 [Terracidiphilus sp.]